MENDIVMFGNITWDDIKNNRLSAGITNNNSYLEFLEKITYTFIKDGTTYTYNLPNANKTRENLNDILENYNKERENIIKFYIRTISESINESLKKRLDYAVIILEKDFDATELCSLLTQLNYDVTIENTMGDVYENLGKYKPRTYESIRELTIKW